MPGAWRSKSEASEGKQNRIEAELAAVRAVLPIAKADAITVLRRARISRDEARHIIDERCNIDWVISGSGTRGDRCLLTAIAAQAFPTPAPGNNAAAYQQQGTLFTSSECTPPANDAAPVNGSGPSNQSPNGQSGEGIRKELLL
jgi:hypothetical protein